MIGLRETVLAAAYTVVNARGVAVSSFDTPEAAWAFITPEEAKRRGPLSVEYVERIERRQGVRRLRRAA